MKEKLIGFEFKLDKNTEFILKIIGDFSGHVYNHIEGMTDIVCWAYKDIRWRNSVFGGFNRIPEEQLNEILACVRHTCEKIINEMFKFGWEPVQEFNPTWSKGSGDASSVFSFFGRCLFKEIPKEN